MAVAPGTWVTSVQPSAELTAVEEPFRDLDTGNVWQIFSTKNGVLFARVVEPSGFILWLQQRP